MRYPEPSDKRQEGEPDAARSLVENSFARGVIGLFLEQRSRSQHLHGKSNNRVTLRGLLVAGFSIIIPHEILYSPSHSQSRPGCLVLYLLLAACGSDDAS